MSSEQVKAGEIVQDFVTNLKNNINSDLSNFGADQETFYRKFALA